MPNLQEYVNQRNPVTVYSPTRAIERNRRRTGQQVLAGRGGPGIGAAAGPINLQLGGGGSSIAPMPDTSSMSSLDAALAHARQVSNRPPVQPEHQGGIGGFLGSVANSIPGKVAMGALTVLDYPRRIVASGIQEGVDAFNGGDASWDDFTHQIHEGIGFGDIIGSTGNIWLDRGIGLLGDIALDPMTYVGGAGILAGTGREARAGLAARVLEMGLGEDLAKKVGRYGIHGLSDAERQMVAKAGKEAGGIFAEGAEKIKDAGYYFHFPFSEREFAIPGTAMVDRFVGGTAARTRAGLAASPLGGWLRHRNADEAVVQAINRLVAGEGTISLSAAAETYNWYQALKLGSGMAKREAEAAIAVMLKKSGGTEGLSLMLKDAEEVGGTALNDFFARMAKVLDDVGIDHGTIKNYIPHYYTEAGKVFLGKETLEAKAMAKVFGAGNSLEDYSPSLMKRHFVPRENPYIINGQEFHIRKGTIDEINSEFRRVTGKDFDLLETDVTKILSRYSESVGDDVGRMTGVMRLLKSKTGLLRNKSDAEVLKAMVDDVATHQANQNMKTQLADQLNRVGEAAQQLSEELAKGLHNTGSDLLKARFATIIDNLTSLTESDRVLLAKALDVDSGMSRLLGRTSARGETNASSALLEAFNDRVGPMVDRVNALNDERAKLLRAAELERNMLVSSLATAKAGGAAFDAIPQRLANLQRYQAVTAKLMETQRDLVAIRALQDQMAWAVHQADTASKLADDGRFLTQFLPGEADRIATAQKIENQTRARNATVELVAKPLDPIEIARTASEARHQLANTLGSTMTDRPMTPRMAQLQTEFQAAAASVDRQHQRMIQASDALHEARVANNGAIAAANAHAEGVAQAYAAAKLEYDSLQGDPAKVFERQQLDTSLRELQRGQIAETKRAIEQARKPVRDAETALEAERVALVKENAKFIAAARKIDEEAAVPLASPAGLPETTYTPEQMTQIHSQLSDLQRQQKAWEATPEGKARAQRQATQAELIEKYQDIDGEITLLTTNVGVDGGTFWTLDSKGDVVLRRSSDAAVYEQSLKRDDFAKEFDVRKAELDAARADADAYRLRDNATAGQQARKDAKVRGLEKKVEAAAKGRDDINRELMGVTRKREIIQTGEVHKRYVPTDTPAMRHTADRLEKLVLEKADVARRLRGLESKLTGTVSHDAAARERNIAVLTEQVREQTESVQRRAQAAARVDATEADRAARASRRAAHDEMLGITPRVDVPIARPMEARAFAIQAEADRKLSQRERIIGRAIDNARETTMGEAPSIEGLQALSSADRFSWEHAQAVIRERDSFPGGESNPMVQRARRTIKELRPAVGPHAREDVFTTGTRDAFTPMNAALEGIEESRTAWKPKTKLGKKINTKMEANVAGLRAQGGAKDTLSRARSARDWGTYVRTEVKPELMERGALPSGSEVMGTPDIALHMDDALEDLHTELDMYAKEPSALGEERLENALAKVNRWSEFALRYQAALKAGVQADTQTATFVWARTLGNESNNLGAQISQLEARLKPSLSGPQITKIQERWAPDRAEMLAAREAGRPLPPVLPPNLRVSDLTTDERNEVRFLNDRYKLETQIEKDQEIVRKINEKEASGAVLEPGEKGSRTLANNRIKNNTHKLDLHNAGEGGVSPGPMQGVVDHIAGILNKAISDYGGALNDTRLEEDAAKTAARMGETATNLKVHIAHREGQIEAWKAEQARFTAAIDKAEAEGKEVVRWRPVTEEEVFISVDEAQRMLDNNELPEYIRPQVEAAIGQSRRRSAARTARSFNLRDRDSLMARAQKVRESRQAGSISRKEATAELASIRERLAVIDSWEARFKAKQNPAAFVEAGLEPGEVAPRVAEPEVIRGSGRRKPKGDRRAANARNELAGRREAFAAEKGLHPDDVISSKRFVMADIGGVRSMPIADARVQAAKDAASVSKLEAALAEDRLQSSIYDGSINTEVNIQKAILADQAGAELPDTAHMQSMLDEISARAANRRQIFETGGRVGSFEEMGQVLSKDVDRSTFMTPDEAAQADELGQRIAAIQRYGRMTDEQKAGVQSRLDEISKKIREYERKMGSRFDQIDAIHDNGERYFNSLLDGTRQPTIKDVALMRDILGAAQTDVAAAFVTQLNELLGLTRRNARTDLDIIVGKLGHPPITGPERQLLFESTDPSRLELEELRRAVNSIPLAKINEQNIEQIQGWQRALDHLTTDPIDIPPELGGRDAMRLAMGDKTLNLTPEKIREVFTALGVSFGDSQLLAGMRQAVVDAEDAGIAITNGTLRDVVARTLVSSAKQREQVMASDLNKLMNALGLRFQPGVVGLSGKLAAMGYVMGGENITQVKLREFITRQLEQAGIPLDGRLEDQLAQLKLRKMHVDSMRIGLGADLKDMPWERDPRLLFEATSKPHLDKARKIENEIQAFNGAVTPMKLDQIYNERLASLQAQLAAASKAGDTDRMSTIYDMIGDLDGRRMAEAPSPAPVLPDVPMQEGRRREWVDAVEYRRIASEKYGKGKDFWDLRVQNTRDTGLYADIEANGIKQPLEYDEGIDLPHEGSHRTAVAADIQERTGQQQLIPVEYFNSRGGDASVSRAPGPSASEPPPVLDPQVTFETQMTKAEGNLTGAAQAVNQARTELATIQKRIDDGIPAEFTRHPDTPAEMYSLGEFMGKNAQIRKATQTGTKDEIDALGREYEQMMPKLWQAEPEESKAAVLAAAKGAPTAETELDAARSRLNQAEEAQAEAQRKVDQLRERGPAEVVDDDTPEHSLGELDDAADENDPDAGLTFEQAHSEYGRMMKEVEGFDKITNPTDDDIQRRAAAAARARKMADMRGRKWPARRVELERQRAEAYARATNTDLLKGEVFERLEPGTVTWNVWHTVTTGAPNSRYFHPPPGTKVAGRGSMRQVGMVGNMLEALPANPAGRYMRNNLPQLQRSISERLAPALEQQEGLRQIMLEARNSAEEIRGRIQQHLDAYDGVDMEGEVARLTAEKEGLEASLARPLGEEELQAQRMAAADRMREIENEVAREQRDLVTQQREARQVMRQTEREYTEAVRTADETLADVRTAIHDTGQRLDDNTAELKKFKVLDYQGVSADDMLWHTEQLHELNDALPALTPDAQAEAGMIGTLLDAAMVQAQKLQKLGADKLELNKRLKDFESGADSVANVIKHEIADGWTPMFKELIDPDGPDAVVMANELARAIGNLDAALRKPESWGLVDQFTRLFKTYATATPGFHVRNLISGIFMNYVDNVRTGHMLRAGRIWNDFIRDPQGYMSRLAPESDERRALMVVFGSGASGTWVDTGDLPRGFGERGSRLMNNRLTKWNQRMGSRVEGTLRLGMALDSMAKGQNVAAALERVTRYHFDYSRLSKVDHTMRRLVPFWTFLSRNIPLQIESMWLRPATYLHYQSFVRNFGEAADPLTPEYWLSQGAFTMNQDAEGAESPWYLAPDLPFLRVAEPLDALAHGDLGRAGLSNLNPLIGAPIEAFAAHRKFYSGSPVNQEYNEPTAAMRALMPIFAMLGGTKEGGTSGDRLLDDRYAHVARSMLPPLNLIERLTDTTGPREGRTDETWLRTIGAPVYQLTDNLRNTTARTAYYDARDAARARADLAGK